MSPSCRTTIRRPACSPISPSTPASTSRVSSPTSRTSRPSPAASTWWQRPTTDRPSSRSQVNPDGSFGEAVWTHSDLPGSDLMTGNIAYQNVFGGIYNTERQRHRRQLSRRRRPVLCHRRGRAGHAGRLAQLRLCAVGRRQHRRHHHGLGDRRQRAGRLDRQRRDHGHQSTTASGHDLHRRRRRHHHAGGRRQRAQPRRAVCRQRPVQLHGAEPGEAVAHCRQHRRRQGRPAARLVGSGDGQLGGPVSDAQTNAGLGTGTSQDMSTVANFSTGTASSPLDMSTSRSTPSAT